MPIGNDTIQVTTSAVKARTKVRPSRFQSRSETGASQSNERPKSPSKRMFEIQIQYCTQIGSSRPYWARSIARVFGSMVSPICDICAASEVTKSPGGSWIRMKETIEIAMSVGIM